MTGRLAAWWRTAPWRQPPPRDCWPVPESLEIGGLDHLSDSALTETARLVLDAMAQARSIDASRLLWRIHSALAELVAERDRLWILRMADELAEQAARERPC